MIFSDVIIDPIIISAIPEIIAFITKENLIGYELKIKVKIILLKLELKKKSIAVVIIPKTKEKTHPYKKLKKQRVGTNLMN